MAPDANVSLSLPLQSASSLPTFLLMFFRPLKLTSTLQTRRELDDSDMHSLFKGRGWRHAGQDSC